ncbi:hypothetical protein F0Q45_18605 [Mycobacterium simiae]|uniref:Uncharacterized protein n=1 Tax=Mycobacterium simiae TaxID=1784 RepID=A0A5B1BNH1_MYCSI|nr:hypothetical protein [Mycobacterium simiae]KAA1248794.1 hypothetical protein F0Q45_18605 [Mycobacterium simiae]
MVVKLAALLVSALLVVAALVFVFWWIVTAAALYGIYRGGSRSLRWYRRRTRVSGAPPGRATGPCGDSTPLVPSGRSSRHLRPATRPRTTDLRDNPSILMGSVLVAGPIVVLVTRVP